MTDIVGQFAFDGASIPPHIDRSQGDQGLLPFDSISGSATHKTDKGAIWLKGYPTLNNSCALQEVAEQVLDGYFSSGRKIVEKLRGPFALAIVEPDARKCIVAIDRMGIEKLCWGRAGGWVAIGTSASDVARAMTSKPELANQALFNFMYNHMVAAPDSVFKNVRKLLPGTLIEFSEKGNAETRYWQPDFSRDNDVNIDQLSQETRPLLRSAIKNLDPDSETGAFLSGGLDSSTVAGLLADVRSEETKAFSVGFGVAEYDEMEFARAAAKKFDLAHHIYEVTPGDIVELIPRIAAAYDEPFGNSSAVPTFCCARFALEHGVDHLLAGDAGDELFGGNERYVRHRIFELYNRVPAWLQNTIFGPLAKRIDPESGIYPLRKFSSYVQQAQIPLPERFESWNLAYREGADRIFHRDFLKTINPAHVFEAMRDVWRSCPSDDLLDRMLWYDWKFTLADNDLRKVSRMCELAGVRVSYPMLDEDFVAHSMKVPSNEKIKGYELRTFFKNAVRGYVPDMVIKKEKHGFGLPFGVWLKTNRPLQDLVYGSLDSLRHRNIFDLAFLDQVHAEHKDGHAAYYGSAIWDLVMLEQWLAHHVP